MSLDDEAQRTLDRSREMGGQETILELKRRQRILSSYFPVMTKHSKNNTASSVFSYSEYKRLDYGTKRVRLPPPEARHVLTLAQQRLGNESMRRFDAWYVLLTRLWT